MISYNLADRDINLTLIPWLAKATDTEFYSTIIYLFAHNVSLYNTV